MPAADPLKQAQQAAWSDPASVAAWRKWFPQFVVHTRAATEALLRAANVAPGMQVLDVAGGSGDPALALAQLAGPNGHVTTTDLVPAMLAIAAEQAQCLGLRNLTFQPADAEALPFAAGAFERVTCRFGIIYCPDAARALREMYRVLRPGGRAALVAWGPPAQPFFSTTVGVFARHVTPAPLPPGAPMPFQFAQPGSLSALLRAAGFHAVREETPTIGWAFPGTVEECWEYQREITGAAFRRYFAALPPERSAQVIAEVLAAIGAYYDGRQVNYSANIVVASGAR